MFSLLKRRISFLFQFQVTPKSRFKVGETVINEDILYPMVIKQVVRSLKPADPLLYCQWFDKVNQETRMSLVHESKLKPFDWKKIKE